MKRLYEVNITDAIHICKSDYIREIHFYKSDFVYLRKHDTIMQSSDIQPLVNYYHWKIKQVNLNFKRYLFNRINWDARIIGIKGARGVGKTTLLLQRILEKYKDIDDTFYITLDHLWFRNHSLEELVEYLYTHGITEIYIDEVHKYKDWSQSLKTFYDEFADLRIVYTGSSMLEIEKSSTDLARRQTPYRLDGLSFREYLKYTGALEYEPLRLPDILQNHVATAMDICGKTKILKMFDKYLKTGYYPYFTEAKNDFLIRLAETAKLVIENDLPAVLDVNYATIEKTQKLLMIIAEHVPLKPTTEKLASSISSTRDSCLKMMYLLDKAAILRLLTTELKSYKRLVNPEKIYLDNTNLMYALGSNVNEGNLRETFFFNQVGNTHDVRSSHAGDFLIDGKLRVEVGGSSKDFSRIADIPDSFLAIDGIETGYGARIPLWLFGFLY